MNVSDAKAESENAPDCSTGPAYSTLPSDVRAVADAIARGEAFCMTYAALAVLLRKSYKRVMYVTPCLLCDGHAPARRSIVAGRFLTMIACPKCKPARFNEWLMRGFEGKPNMEIDG